MGRCRNHEHPAPKPPRHHPGRGQRLSRAVLITGGAGFIAGNLTHHWCAAHPLDRVLVLDALTYAGNLATIQPLIDAGRIRFVQGDISDRELVDGLLVEKAITHVAHLAAESHVDRSITGPGAFLATNVTGTFTLLEAFRAHWLAAGQPQHWRFLHVSTDEVFGSLEAEDPPFCETTAYDRALPTRPARQPATIWPGPGSTPTGCRCW